VVTARDRLDQTNRFLDVLESADRPAMAEMLDDEVVWSAPMSFSGNAADGHPADTDPARGREAFESRLASISSLMRSARFVDRRITVSADGATTFVQTQGEFVTTDDRPYRNVYVFRFDWRDDKITSWEEYANPITILLTFPDRYGHLIAGLLSSS
jgi:ketosteroid isomerase-like protein